MTHTTFPSPTVTEPETGFAVTALVLGILGVFMFWLYGVLPILAVVFGAVSRSKSSRAGVKPSPMATAGLVLGIVELALIAFILLAVVAAA